VPAFFDHLPQSPFDLGKRSHERRAPRVDNDIPLRSEFSRPVAKRFAKSSFDPVSHHRAPDLPGNREPKPSTFRAIAFEAERGEHRTGNADAVVIDEAKIGGLEDPRSSPERQLTLWQTGRLFRR